MATQADQGSGFTPEGRRRLKARDDAAKLAMADIMSRIPNEEAAVRVLRQLRHRFGWSLHWRDRADIEYRAGRRLTDREWTRVQATTAWEDATWADQPEAFEGCETQALAEAEVDLAQPCPRCSKASQAGWVTAEDPADGFCRCVESL